MNKTELATDIIAGAAIISPWWLPTLQNIHDGAAWILPLLGVLWLAIQIGFFLYRAKN